MVDTLDTGSLAVLGLVRTGEGETLVGLFNFGGDEHPVSVPEGEFADMLTGEKYIGSATLPPYGFFWLQKQG